MNGFPGMQWGNFGPAPTPPTPQRTQQPVQTQPAPVDVPEIDFRDGLNNAVELALHPNVDLVGMEAAAPNMGAGTVAHFRTVITRADRPGWQQEIAGQARMNPDGMGSQTHATMGPPNQPVLQLVEQASTQLMQGGTQITGQVAPGRYQGANEQLVVAGGQNGGLQVQGHVDGWQIYEQSQDVRDPQGGWGQVKVHSGQLGDVPFQRVLRPAQDGSQIIQGQIGPLPESGRVMQSADGQTRVTRDIGPYHLEQAIWFVADPNAQMMAGGGFGGGFFG